jgi:hypothetical protein
MLVLLRYCSNTHGCPAFLQYKVFWVISLRSVISLRVTRFFIIVILLVYYDRKVTKTLFSNNLTDKNLSYNTIGDTVAISDPVNQWKWYAWHPRFNGYTLKNDFIHLFSPHQIYFDPQNINYNHHHKMSLRTRRDEINAEYQDLNSPFKIWINTWKNQPMLKTPMQAFLH